MTPRLSILLCTYRAPDLVRDCLESILAQTLHDFEVWCIDGGGDDATVAVVREFAARDPRVRLLDNPRGYAEGAGGGKSLGFGHATGEYVAIIDQDNVLHRADLFERACAELERDLSAVGVLGGLVHDRRDPPVVRYVALVGTDSFFAYRSVDFLRRLRGAASAGTVETFPQSANRLALTGGNCFFYRRADVEQVGGYNQDVLVVQRLVRAGADHVLIVPDATTHRAEQSLRALAWKKFTWSRTHFSGARGERFDYLPRTAGAAVRFAFHLAASLLIVPNFIPALVLLARYRDGVALLYPLMGFLNTIAYGAGFVRARLTGQPEE